MHSTLRNSILLLGLAACAAPAPERAHAPHELVLPGPGEGKRAFEIADFYRCAVVSAPAVSPDGARAAFGVRRYELEAGKSWSELWLIGTDGSGLKQLTARGHNDTDPRFSPDGRTLLFVSDRSGTSQLWTLPLDGGEPVQLTNFGPGVEAPVYSPDGKWLAVTSELFPECGIDEACNAKQSEGLEGKLKVHVADELLYRHWTAWRDGRRAHVLLVDAASGKVTKDLTPGDFESPNFSLGDRGYAFSPDSKELCFSSNRERDQASTTNVDLWVVPVDGDVAQPRNLTVENKGFDGAPLYSPDGRYLAYISQATPGCESDLKRLALYDRKSGDVRYLTDRDGFDDWVDDMRWIDDANGHSTALVFQAQVHGRTPLYFVELEHGEPKKLLEDSFLVGWEVTGKEPGIVYTRRSIDSPSEVFVARLPHETKQQLTQFNQTVGNEVDIRPPLELWLEGDGDYEVQCFVVTPHGFDPSKKYPLILNVHGGPQSQWADAFRGDWQVYPGKGYVVAFCNPTGSTGHGQDFTDAISRDWGGRVYRDLMKAVDQLDDLPWIDAERVGVMGWSYGGYMAMWMQGHTERFECIASMMGVYDLKAMYGATEELWFPEWDLGGTPWTSEHFERWSPDRFVPNFKTPALVITGEKDYRVPYTQSLEYFTHLQKMGVPSRLVAFPNAGHWPSWYEMAFYFNAHVDFFAKWLGGEPATYDVKKFSRNQTFERD
ncbi:MAG: S9 family peptidase [Planctomycetes bacterium]|nr:S9 family peptidase [Planctomycetota bacterium]